MQYHTQFGLIKISLEIRKHIHNRESRNACQAIRHFF